MKKERAKKRSGKKFLKYWQLYLLILPAIVYVFIFSYLPMYGVQIAFRNYRSSLGIWGSEWVGLAHFKRFISFPNFKLILKNTLSLGIYSLATFPLAIIFALMLNELRNEKFKKLVQMVTYMPHFLSTVIVCSIVTLFFNQKTGVVNTVITALGGESVAFLENADNFADLYVWSGVWQGIGWSSIIYIAALAGVSSELIEAARIDGATRLQVIWHVNIPHILPTVVTMLILSCGSILSVGFEKVWLLQNSLNLSKSQVISTYVYEIGIRGGQFSYSSAIGLFNTLVNMTLLVIVNKVAKKVTDTGIF